MIGDRFGGKIDPIKMSLARPIKYPSSSGYVLFGKTNSGKSVLMMTLSLFLSQKYNFKIWDLWGGKRNQGENLYLALPSRHCKVMENTRKLFRFDNSLSPKQLLIRFAYPISKDIPAELPLLKKDTGEIIVDSKPFTIPIKNITIKMIRHSINNISDNDITLWEEIKGDLLDTDGIAELEHLYEKRSPKSSLYNNFFKPLIENRMLSSLKDENILDFKLESRDRDRAFVLVLHHIPDKFRLFVLGYIMFTLWDLMGNNKIHGKNVINIREATEFFRATEKSVLEDRFKQFKIDLTEFIRQARGKFAFILDAQSPTETAGFVPGSFDIEIYGKMPSEDDRRAATEQLKRDDRITTNQIKDLGDLEKGEYYFVESGDKARKYYSFLPLCDFWKEQDKDFYSIWRSKQGDYAFKDIVELLKTIDKKYKEEKLNIKSLDQLRESQRKEKLDMEKAIKEDEELKQLSEKAKQKKLAEMKGKEEAKREIKRMKEAEMFDNFENPRNNVEKEIKEETEENEIISKTEIKEEDLWEI